MSIDIATLRPKLEAALGEQLKLGPLLGQGGFAAVFRAHDPFLERDVAIKVLDPSLAVDAALEEQFLHEARTIAAAEHPHIVPLYSAEATGGLLYLVMRLLPGHSLEDRIAEGKLPPSEAARIALECAGALAAAHAAGVVHRDIKRANILLDANGNATVTDFGIALVTARVIVIGSRILLQIMSFMMGGGEGADPALIASGGAVPDSIVRLARETGSVRANEAVALVFIQANHTFSDALFFTDSAIIRRTPNATIRRSLEDSDVNLQPIKRGGSAGGLLIVKQKGAAPDTLYQNLSGREAFLLMNEFATLRRAQEARNSIRK